MANLFGIARPYAIAAFEYARDHQELAAWKALLSSAAIIAKDPAVASLLNNPQVPIEKLFTLFSDILSTTLTTEQKNFLLLLTQHKRFIVLPEIADLFDAHYAALEKISHIRVITAIEATQVFQQQLAQVLAKRIQREVTLQCEIDPTILGGAVIYIGGQVIDGSVRGKLTRLLEFSLR